MECFWVTELGQVIILKVYSYMCIIYRIYLIIMRLIEN